MSMPNIRNEVEMMLAQANERIAKVEAKHEKGSLEERVAAAGELAVLKHQKDVLERRLKEIDSAGDSHETLWAWLKEDLFNITFHLDKVIQRH